MVLLVVGSWRNKMLHRLGYAEVSTIFVYELGEMFMGQTLRFLGRVGLVRSFWEYKGRTMPSPSVKDKFFSNRIETSYS